MIRGWWHPAGIYLGTIKPHQRIIFFLLTFGITQASLAQSLEQEVQALQGPEEVPAYWEDIERTDQAHRGLNTIDSLDNIDLKKVILMIQYHGYPTGNPVPNLVFTHQRSAYVREHYFPILLLAWEQAQADTFWFMRNVRMGHEAKTVKGMQVSSRAVQVISLEP